MCNSKDKWAMTEEKDTIGMNRALESFEEGCESKVR